MEVTNIVSLPQSVYVESGEWELVSNQVKRDLCCKEKFKEEFKDTKDDKKWKKNLSKRF